MLLVKNRDPLLDEVMQRFGEDIPEEWLGERWLQAVCEAWQAAAAPGGTLHALENQVRVRATFTAALTRVKQVLAQKTRELDRALKTSETRVRSESEKKLTLDEVAARVQETNPVLGDLRAKVDALVVLRDHLFGLRGDMDDRRDVLIERSREERAVRKEDDNAL
jgi:hypothetical protein